MNPKLAANPEPLSTAAASPVLSPRSRFGLGIACALAAGAWLGAAEAPARLVASGFSPFAISFCMVWGVFLARWTLPIAMKGTHSVVRDLRQRPHLMLWAVLAGGLWSVANTLTIFAIRDVGLSIAFPLWNTNTLVGIFWGWALFQELRGASARSWAKVAGGAVAIVVGSVLLSLLSVHNLSATPGKALAGVAAALGAGLLWGTMYVPYRKAYLSGVNPLSFVTIFTFGEIGTMLFLAAVLPGSFHGLIRQLHAMRPSIFWVLLGGFCWVIGDLFQQYATKYVGISRAIPLSNTNQLWGFAWGVLVFGELAGSHGSARLMALGASGLTIFGAMLIAGATVSDREAASTVGAIRRECDRYGLDMNTTLRTQEGFDEDATSPRHHSWADFLILAAAVAVFAWFARFARVPRVPMHIPAALVLAAILIAVLAGAGWLLWKKTRFA
ncbi:MAG TPA: GRP family sugar transporter [Acidobacteriaceae bacterium]|nr:GRP family sugar transporter [Acidobacteriaceae bacterium]